MYIGNTQAAVTTAYNAPNASQTTTTAEEAEKRSTVTKPGGADSVTISEEARRAAEAERGLTKTSDQMDNKYTDLEHYRLPNWLPAMKTGYLFDHGKAIDETRATMKMLEEVRSDGIVTHDEQRRIDEWRRTSMPEHDRMLEYHYFYQKHEREILEYQEIFRGIYNDAKAEQGIESHEDYVEKVLNAPGDNIALRDSVATKLLDNPRAVELMDILNIQRPTIKTANNSV